MLLWSRPKYGCVEPLLAISNHRTGRAEKPEVVAEAAAVVFILSAHESRFQGFEIMHDGLKCQRTLCFQTRNEEAIFYVDSILGVLCREKGGTTQSYL